MSRENVELVRNAFAGWERGDYSPGEWHHSDVEFVMADGPNPGRWTGSDGVGEGWGDFLSAWRDFRQVADAYRELDAERVLVLFHFSGHGKTSGLEVEQMGSQAAGLFHIRDGKVSRVDLYFDRSAALAAVGLSEQAMSRENVELVRSAFGAFERGEIGEMLESMADDLTTHRVDPDDAIYHGKEGFLQATADWIEGFEEWTVTPEEFVESGESVVVRVHQTARGETSGVAVENQMWFVFDFRGGKVARVSFHLREAEALEAVGLSK